VRTEYLLRSTTTPVLKYPCPAASFSLAYNASSVLLFVRVVFNSLVSLRMVLCFFQIYAVILFSPSTFPLFFSLMNNLELHGSASTMLTTRIWSYTDRIGVKLWCPDRKLPYKFSRVSTSNFSIFLPKLSHGVYTVRNMQYMALCLFRDHNTTDYISKWTMHT
jgi:hypothetical protein